MLGKSYYVDRFSGRKRQKVLKSDKFYYVPLLDTIKLLLNNTEVLKEVFSPHEVEGDFLGDFCDGSLYKAHPMFVRSTSLALMLSYHHLLNSEPYIWMVSLLLLMGKTEHFMEAELLHGPLLSHFSTSYGINRQSILMDIPGFSVISSLPHDIMHDLFEGVVPYELKLLIRHCVQQSSL